MFRDRTNLYLSYRRTYPHHQHVAGQKSRFDALEEEEELIGGSSGFKDQHNLAVGEDGQEGIELATLPPSFMDISDELDDNIEVIIKQTEKLSALYKKNLLPGFSDTTIDEEEIEKLNYLITNKFLQCNNLLKKLEMNKNNSRIKNDDILLIDNMKKNFAIKIQNLSSKFRKLQNNYIKFLKKDDYQANNNLVIEEESSKELENYSKEAIKQSSSILQQQSSINDSLIRQREQEITKLAQGVLEVSSIFKEMQNMVIDQGTILDRIDYNLENTKVELKEATSQLNRAQNYQKRTQKCKIILLLSLISFGLFIVLLVKPHHTTKVITQPAPHAPEPAKAPAPTGPANTASEALSDDHIINVDIIDS